MNLKLLFTTPLLLATLSFCSSVKEGSPAANGMNKDEGTLRGSVTVGPLFPGPVRIDEPEPKPPAEFFENHRIRILSEDGSQLVKETSLDSEGSYRVDLEPGIYLIDFVPHDTGIRPYVAKRVEIRAGETTVHDIDIDTGMR